MWHTFEVFLVIVNDASHTEVIINAILDKIPKYANAYFYIYIAMICLLFTECSTIYLQ